MNLTRRQQQVMRRMLHGDAQWSPALNAMALPSAGQLPCRGESERRYVDEYGVFAWTSTNTLRSLMDAEMVGQHWPRAGLTVSAYALTPKGRMVAAALTRGDGEESK